MIWRDLSPDQLARLHLYEAAFGYTLDPVEVVTPEGEVINAMAYFPPKSAQATLAPWSFETWVRDHGAASVITAGEIYTRDPRPSHSELRAQWPNDQRRSEARQRAGRTSPATLRHAPNASDMPPIERGAISGGFLRLQEMMLQHRRFDGEMSERMNRDVLVGFDAAFVLPYDPVRDHVCLVEQFRVGPAARGAANPWMLEPIAGMIDPHEAPIDTATREAVEEAGLHLRDLEKMFEGYASPGSSTDYFHFYIGMADLPLEAAGQFGLASEQEDIRTHIVPFAQAMDLIESGEIAVAPLITMLLWLSHHRGRLRANA